MRYLIIISFLLYQDILAQSAAEKILQEENNFANISMIIGTKTAFLQYLGEESIVFSDGKAVSGLPFWTYLQFNDKLNWKPYFVEVSAGKDLAYTIGTYQYFTKNDSSKPAEVGHFSSIWKKQRNGTWRVALDIGQPVENEMDLVYNVNQLPKIIESPQNLPFKKDTTGLKAAIFMADLMLSNHLMKYKNKVDSYSKNAQKFTQSLPNYIFKPVAAEVSISGDLAYVYGNIETEVKKGNYLRIWRKEGRKVWKVALEIVNN